jgi:hypothetical protein
VTAVQCNECGAPVPEEWLHRPDVFQCQFCRSSIQVFAFPAAFRVHVLAPAGVALSEGESSCFYHSHKPAVAPCDQCGRFLCSLCRVDFGERVLCPQCIQSGAKKGSLTLVESRRNLYDSIAMALAILPGFLIWPTLITAPIAIYLSIRHWNRPLSIVPRSRWRFVVAILVALLQIGTWIALGIFFFGMQRRMRV